MFSSTFEGFDMKTRDWQNCFDIDEMSERLNDKEEILVVTGAMVEEWAYEGRPFAGGCGRGGIEPRAADWEDFDPSGLYAVQACRYGGYNLYSVSPTEAGGHADIQAVLDNCRGFMGRPVEFSIVPNREEEAEDEAHRAFAAVRTWNDQYADLGRRMVIKYRKVGKKERKRLAAAA